MQIDKCFVCLTEIKKKGIRGLFEPKMYCCQKCLYEMALKIKKITIKDIHGYGFYEYNHTLQSIIYKYKGCYDIELSNVFLSQFKTFLKLKYFDHIFVPAPSYEEANKKRGFNHVKQILDSLELKYVDCLIKIENIKQANLNNKERKNIKKYLKFKEGYEEKIKDKKVVIFDDVLTTGSTILGCAELIKRCGVKEISFVTIAYTRR